ncbi:MAG: hypothetical protein Q8S73_13800 [Deltaproteobacteria bacterium]|nr:hypothetical protein [Myxococcales bacterium]MDP3215175.1 hypothetical protein [Deltaproteobacteria bacterium]
MRRIGVLGVVLCCLACSSNGSTLLDGPDALTTDDLAASDVIAADSPAPDAAAPEAAVDDAPAPDSAVDVTPLDDAPSVDVPSIDVPSVDDASIDVSSIDVPSIDVSTADVGPTCRSSSDCAGGAICSSLLRRCVECSSDPECPSERPVCAGGLCVVRNVCTSSRMCPGEVCDPTAQSCVRCSVDLDCDAGERCVTHSCVADTPCRSSVQCSQLGMVCDVTAGRCVDCVADLDCGAGAFCAPSGLCRRLVCVPSSAVCVDTMTTRTCDARGSLATTTPCAAGQSCLDGRCVMRVCTPGSAECVDGTLRRACRADGLGYEAPVSCLEGQSCSAGACLARVCTPGAPGGCVDATTAQVCNADGLGYGSVVCSASANAPARCVADGCALVCTTGYASCDGADTNGCEVDTRTSNSHCGGCGLACAPGQRCVGGVCGSGPIACPSSCGTDLDCNPCRTSSDPDSVRYCCLSGLCISMTGICPSTLPDGGFSDGGTSPDAETSSDGGTSPG